MTGRTEVTTVKLWEHVNANPGVTTDELVAAAIREHMVPQGFANRSYARNLTSNRRRALRSNGRYSVAHAVHPGEVDRHKAVNHVVRTTLRDMKRWGSLRQEDDRWFVSRPLHRRGIGALVVPRDDVMADAALRNLRIHVGRHLDELRSGKSYMPRAIRELLVTWYEASEREYAERRRALEESTSVLSSDGRPG